MQDVIEHSLVGIGLYTPAEAGHLLGLAPARISRWLRGHVVDGVHYDALWQPEVDFGEDGIFLGFRDLQEVRVAAAFIEKGLSAQRVRDVVLEQRPLSTTRFRTDGRSVFLQVLEDGAEPKLIDLFKKQFAFREVLERSLTNVEYDSAGVPKQWWPLGRAASVVLDPTMSFGQPIEAETSVPIEALVAAVQAEGSPETAARVWGVPVRAVKRALAFKSEMQVRQAA